MDITGISKSKILIALYNRSKQQGMGLLQPRQELTLSLAEELLKETFEFYYLFGKVMKIDLSGNVLDTRLYNRDNGANAAEDAILAMCGINK